MITVVGESLVDVVRRPDGEVSAHPGGSPANVAVGLARLGAAVTFVTHYGDDAHGRMIDRHLRDNGVLTPSGRRPGTATSVAEATLDDAGLARYEFRVRWQLGPRPPQVPESSLCLHTGSIAAVLEPGASTVEAMVRQARDLMTISYDPNCRPTLMGTPVEARPRVERLVRYADVVKVSDEDLGWLYPDQPPDVLAGAWLASGPGLVVVTRGARGCYAVTAGGEVGRPARSVDVVDTVGAGDAFTAGLLDALRRRRLLGVDRREHLRSMEPATVEAVLAEAERVAEITVSRPGADPPTAAELSDRA